MELHGTIAFSTVGLLQYGFDVFSVSLPSDLHAAGSHITEHRHTDGVSINFNGQFAGDDNEAVTFVSERTGSAQLFLSGSPEPTPLQIGTKHSLFHDRPTIRNGQLYFVSAHEPPPKPFESWAAIYMTSLDSGKTIRLTPPGAADISPAVSRSGDLIAVASYNSRPWKGDFHELETEVIVFRPSDPARRFVIADHGGWPAWTGDSTVFFHRRAEDGWWSVYRANLTDDFKVSELRRVTPSGLHAFTPAVSHDGKLIAVATRRKGRDSRQIELFDLESEVFIPITELVNPNLHHYNPFFSSDSTRLGYHRFRGESSPESELIIPAFQPVTSPVSGLRMLRVTGNFPSFSPDGNFIAINGDFFTGPGLRILRSDGTKQWAVLKSSAAFYTAWSPAERGVIYTSTGPIFESSNAMVQIARISFNPSDLTDDKDEVHSEVKILTRTDTGNNAFPSCSPDGKHVVFRSGRSGHKNLYIVDAVKGEGNNGEGIRRLTEGDWIDTMPSWSPDGELIAFSSNRHRPDDPAVFSIYVVRPDGTGLRRIHVADKLGADVDRERINHVCFSEDSTWLVFTANMASVTADPVSLPNQFQPYGDLYVVRLDGTGLTRLTYNAYENGTPAWCGAGVEMAIGSMKLGEPVGEKLTGQFDDPLWLTCDI